MQPEDKKYFHTPSREMKNFTPIIINKTLAVSL